MTTIGSNSWAAGLVKTLNDKKNHIISSSIGVVINDKYPKAKYHFLVLPWEDIPSIFHLSKKHLSVLEELHLLGLNIIEVKDQKVEDFQLGFHAQPSMQRLHLHVISKDFVSDCLKTKKHWNSFNTKLFVPYEVLYEELNVEGSIKRFEKSKIDNLLAKELSCNQCVYIAKNMPNLKEHLLEHSKRTIAS